MNKAVSVLAPPAWSKSEPAARPTFHDTLNRPLRDLRLSVIDRCNFRCPYCMPAEEYPDGYTFLDKKEWLTFEEITRLVRLFIKLGVTKIRITGGEPLLRQNLPGLIRLLNQIPGIEDLAITTNGFFLKQFAQSLKAAGLKRITVSLDTLDENIFQIMNGHRGSVKKILAGIKEAGQAGFHPIKINVVVQKGVNDQTLLDLIDYFRGLGHIVRFLEYMDVGNRNHWTSALVVPSSKILSKIHEQFPVEPIKPKYHGEVASRYRFKDGQGEIGFISSVTQPFCGTCTRARLSTDGKLYTCLFASEGVDLCRLLRNGADDDRVLDTIMATWTKRDDRYSEQRFDLLSHHEQHKKIEMYQIGG